MAKIRVGEYIAKIAGGKKEFEYSGSTVEEVISCFAADNEKLKERFYPSGDGSFNKNLIIFVDGEDIRFKKHMKTDIKEDSEISIISPYAGG